MVFFALNKNKTVLHLHGHNESRTTSFTGPKKCVITEFYCNNNNYNNNNYYYYNYYYYYYY